MAVEAARGLVPMLPSALIDLYAKVAAAAPDARIVVTGYPYLLDPSAATVIDPDIITAIRLATDELSTTIEQAVTATQATDVNLKYVDVTAAFAGHGIYSTEDAFINPPDRLKPTDPNAFHPHADGYVAYWSDLLRVAISVFPRGRAIHLAVVLRKVTLHSLHIGIGNVDATTSALQNPAG
jgi:hypothetical protein